MALMPLVIFTPIVISIRGHAQDYCPSSPSALSEISNCMWVRKIIWVSSLCSFPVLLDLMCVNKQTTTKNLALVIYKYPQLEVRISRRLHWSASSSFHLKYIDMFSPNEVLTVLYLKQETLLRKRWHFKQESWQAVQEKQHKTRFAHLRS